MGNPVIVEAVRTAQGKRRGWLAGVHPAVLLGAAGVRSTPSVLIDPLHDEFGWSHGTIGLAVSINVLLFGFIGPFAAALQFRYGLRRVTATALIVIATGDAVLILPRGSSQEVKRAVALLQGKGHVALDRPAPE